MIEIIVFLLLVEAAVRVLRAFSGSVRVEPRALPAGRPPLSLAPRPRPLGPLPRVAPPPPPEPGVQIDAVAVQALGAQCGVCAQGIEEGPVLCGKCEAPHHPECWEYNGGCATYACRSAVARGA